MYCFTKVVKVFLLGVILLLPEVIYAQGTFRGVNFKWGESILHRSPEWYESKEATDIADNVLLYQSKYGAWPKNTDLSKKPDKEVFKEIEEKGEANTIDNNATTRPMRFLALMYDATGQKKYKESFLKGLDYLLESQYDNGGWPQFYPLRKHGYYSEITYNDNAMMNVMFILRDIAQKKAPFGFVDESHREKSESAVEKGIDCILKTQVKQNGRLTVWCAQYDQNTLKPAWARNFEPPSLSGEESVDIVRFLMEIPNPSPEVKVAIEGAVQWFKDVQITGLAYHHKWGENGKPDAFVESDPDAAPLWARFYELETDKPIFIGRDKVIHYKLNEIEQERRGGYAYYGRWPEQLLTEDYPVWQKKYGGK
ncbi:pectate lyase [Saccharicrinis sp. FJH62]|uniref:pectate lyase n=1 Tax=Saccharicrinis sp. FJH62 TaxID=3344657 RepID=UPI0035D44896